LKLARLRLKRTQDASSIHPQGWVPIETAAARRSARRRSIGSIHPQGWVPIETAWAGCECGAGLRLRRSIHPQGWVPIETCCAEPVSRALSAKALVAFTPKGGCPLKLKYNRRDPNRHGHGSIHPQGWVPIETAAARRSARRRSIGSIHPQGWVLVETPVVGRTAVRPYKRSGWDGRANRRSPLQGCIHHRRGRVGADCPPLL
jgi:hypothetical protein